MEAIEWDKNLTLISAQCKVSLNMTLWTGRPGTSILSHARALTLVSFGNAVGFNTRFGMCGPSTRSWICSWHSKNSTRSASCWAANENVIMRTHREVQNLMTNYRKFYRKYYIFCTKSAIG